MDWKDLAGTLAKAGAPIIGSALGGPLGGMIGGAIGNVVADALGTDPTPDAVNTAINSTPADQLQAKLSEADAKWQSIADQVKAESELGQKQVEQTGETMRAELALSNNLTGPWKNVIAVTQSMWRPVAMFVWVATWPWQMWMVLNHAYVRDAAELAGLSSIIYALAMWNAGPAALAGVYAWGRTKEKLSDLVPLPGSTLLDAAKKIIRKK